MLQKVNKTITPGVKVVWLKWLVVAAILVTTWVRVAPLIEGGARLQRQCVIEDGYLMLTIARNLALGKGFSIADGTIPTNGTQPLCTLIDAACFRFINSDRVLGLYAVVALQVVWAILTAVAIGFFGSQSLLRGPHAPTIAILAAVLFYISPNSIMHGQNSLETGLYTLLVLISVMTYEYWRPVLETKLSPGPAAALGGLLGLTFLARNDACLLIAVLLIVHLLRARRAHSALAALIQCGIIGGVAIVVSTPWLWYNATQFGHVVPVSGRAQSLHATFAENLVPAVVAVAENMLLIARIPNAIEKSPWLIGGVIMFLLAAGTIGIRDRAWLRERLTPAALVLALWGLVLFVYYGLFFSQPQFLGRYFFPVAPLWCILAASIVVSLRRLVPQLGSTAGLVLAVVALVPCLFVNVRIYRNGTKHHHFQVVDWVRDNVPETTWVGATQTGTLGYYHDRTINLDGKVNPVAFEYRKQGRIPEYCVKVGVEYIADWAGHAAWADIPAFAENYELLLVDHEKDLAVLRRKLPGEVAPP